MKMAVKSGGTSINVQIMEHKVFVAKQKDVIASEQEKLQAIRDNLATLQAQKTAKGGRK
jgi:hypothetical protein